MDELCAEVASQAMADTSFIDRYLALAPDMWWALLRRCGSDL